MKAENHTFEFEGKRYDGYTATQRQREIERSIRKQERRETAYRAAGLNEKADAAKGRATRLRQKYKEFSETAGLKTQPERMKVYQPKNSVENAHGNDIIKSEPIRFSSGRLLEKHFEKHKNEFPGVSKEEYQRMADKLSKEPISDDVKELKRSDGSISKYKFSTNEFVVITKEKTIRTYFKPVDGKEHWDYERERN